MAFAIDVQQTAEVKMGVLLGRRQALVAEKLLDGSQVCASAQKMRGERMPERMGTYLSFYGCQANVLIDHPLDRPRRQPPALIVQK